MPRTPSATSPRLTTGSAAAGFWIVAAVFLVTMAYSTVPTPLYALYEAREHFEAAVVTVVFAAYAVGVVASLFLAGHLSDVVGRRRMLVIAVLVSAASAVLFLAWSSLPGLIVARVVNGVGVGIATATATAYLSELRARARPNESGLVAATVAGAVNLGGLALGPLVGGLIADLLPAPLITAHAIFLVLLLVAAIVLWAVPETVSPPDPRPPYRPQRLAAPRGDASSRGAFVAAGFAAFAAFALFGLFTSLAPTFMTGTFHDPDHLAGGAAAAAVFLAAAAGQAALVRVPQRVQLTIAVVCCVVGLGAAALGALLPAVVLFVGGGIVAGVGVGVLFRSSLATAGTLAEPGHRGETLALMFLIAYCGLALPALAVGVFLLFTPQLVVLLVFTALVLVVTVTAGLVMRRTVR